MTGTVEQCKSRCNTSRGCVGFSWQKGRAENIASNCWLKQNITNKSPGQPYQTYVRIPGAAP
jgi:hypothetical protein